MKPVWFSRARLPLLCLGCWIFVSSIGGGSHPRRSARPRAELRTVSPAPIRSPKRDPLPLTVKPSDPADPVSVARAFYASRAGDLRLENPASELAVQRVRKDDGVFADVGMTHVKMQQEWKGLPVFGARRIVHLNPDLTVSSETGRTIPTPTIDVTPSITESDAAAIGAGWIPAEEASEREVLGLSHTVELGLFDPSLFGGTGSTHLAYRVAQLGFVSFVDAKSGEVLAHGDTARSGLVRDTYDGAKLAEAVQHPPETINFDDPDFMPDIHETGYANSSCPPGVNRQVCDLHQFIGRSFGYFFETFGRADLSLGQPDLPTAAVARFQYTSCPAVGGLAFPDDYSRPVITMCDGSVTLDIVAHEYSHLLCGAELGEYVIHLRGGESVTPIMIEPWAVNEGWSDFWAMMIDSANWTLAEDLPNGLFRDLSLSVHYDDLAPNVASNLHALGTVLAHAGYLLSVGGVNRTIGVNQIGQDETEARGKVAYLYYYALINHIDVSNTMYQTAIALAQSCRDVARSGSTLTEEDCVQVDNALAAVGMMGTLEIIAPEAVTVFRQGTPLPLATFRANVSDRESAHPPVVTWHSSPEDLFGTDTVEFGRPIGLRSVYATVTFSNGYSATASVEIDVARDPSSDLSTDLQDSSGEHSSGGCSSH